MLYLGSRPPVFANLSKMGMWSRNETLHTATVVKNSHIKILVAGSTLLAVYKKAGLITTVNLFGKTLLKLASSLITNSYQLTTHSLWIASRLATDWNSPILFSISLVFAAKIYSNINIQSSKVHWHIDKLCFNMHSF